jgi:hypothetical protein
MPTPAAMENTKKGMAHLEHVEDPKDRIIVDFAQNINAKYVPLLVFLLASFLQTLTKGKDLQSPRRDPKA